MALTDLQSRSAHGITDFALYALKGGYYRATLTGAVTIDRTYPLFIGLDPGGANRDLTLDGRDAAETGGVTVDATIHGLFRVIHNRADAAENLVVKDTAATPNTIATINQNELGIFYHDGVTGGSGWVLVAIIAAALT